MVKIKIENVVASATAGTTIDLHEVSMALDEAEYEPEKFPGLIYRIKDPKTAILLFSTGKLVCTGAKSVEVVHEVVKRVLEKINTIGVPVVDDPQITIQNIVATSDLKNDLNLNSIAISLGLERVEYEPEQSPGLVYRIEKPKVVALLFSSGKVVCTGARQIGDIEKAIKEITRELQAAGLLK